MEKQNKQKISFLKKQSKDANGECLKNMSNFKEERRVKSRD